MNYFHWSNQKDVLLSCLDEIYPIKVVYYDDSSITFKDKEHVHFLVENGLLPHKSGRLESVES